MPDLIEKTNNMMNRCIQNKKEETEKIINQMAKKNKKQNQQQNDMKRRENKQEEVIDDLENREKKVQKLKDEVPEEITYEFEYDEVQDEDDEI